MIEWEKLSQEVMGIKLIVSYAKLNQKKKKK